MAKITYISGARATELCSVRIGDVHWELGQWGRFLVHGKGARGSGPRDREAYLFAEGRDLLWWYIEEVRGEFCDDPTDPGAPLWPSERLPKAVAALNLPIAPAVGADTFRKALKSASRCHLHGAVREAHPHLLRHACATHNYESGCPSGTSRNYSVTSGRPPRLATWPRPKRTRSGRAWSHRAGQSGD